VQFSTVAGPPPDLIFSILLGSHFSVKSSVVILLLVVWVVVRADSTILRVLAVVF